MNALLETFSCVYSEIMSNIISLFQKLIKGGGVGIRAGGGWKIFQKLISGGGDDYSVLESNGTNLRPPNICRGWSRSVLENKSVY